MNPRFRPVASCSLLALLFGCAADSSSPTPTSQAASATTQAAADTKSTAAPDRPWGSPDLTSGLNVPAGQRFIFAGGQRSGFTAYATNRGAVPVTIVADLDGERREIVTLAPGERASHKFAAREAALFENPSSQDADVKIEVWGETSVGMRYVPMGK
jgi:hypothetical protein